jgi:hypothetical protein
MGVIVATNAGKAKAANLLAGNVDSNVAKYIAFGTGTHVAAVTDTALTTEVSRIGVNSPTLVTTNVTNDTVQVEQTYVNSGGTAVVLTEAGLFDAATGGTMVISSTFAPATLEPGDSIKTTVEIAVA